MKRRIVTVDDVVELLNDMVELDRECITALVNNRLPCNSWIERHATIQVAGPEGNAMVGLLGFLNGLFGVNDENYGAIEVVIDDETEQVAEFRVHPAFRED